jgi:hypothetical protein
VLQAPQDTDLSSDLLAQYNTLTHLTPEDATSQAEQQEQSAEHQELGGEAEVDVDVAGLDGAASMSDKGEVLESAQLASALRELKLPASNPRDRRLYSQLTLSLSQSVFEPLEVTEVLRGSGFKVRGVLSGRVTQINQATDAARVEPMEWIFGRVLIFERRAYLLEGWGKLPFKKRKPLRAELRASLDLGDDLETFAPLSVVRSHAAATLTACRAHASASAPVVSETSTEERDA